MTKPTQLVFRKHKQLLIFSVFIFCISYALFITNKFAVSNITDRFDNTDLNSYHDSQTNANTDSNTKIDSDTNTNTNTNTKTETNTDTDTITNTGTNTNTDSNTNTDFDTNSNIINKSANHPSDNPKENINIHDASTLDIFQKHFKEKEVPKWLLEAAAQSTLAPSYYDSILRDILFWKGQSFSKKQATEQILSSGRTRLLSLYEFRNATFKNLFKRNPDKDNFISLLEEILRQQQVKDFPEALKIPDFLLGRNRWDEPVNADPERCKRSGTYDYIQQYHGTRDEDLTAPRVAYPFFSPAKINDCHNDILLPFSDALIDGIVKPTQTKPERQQEREDRHQRNKLDNKKIKAGIWRGTLTGYNAINKRNHRWLMVQHCANYNLAHMNDVSPKLLEYDVGITQLQETRDRSVARKYMKGKLDMKSWHKDFDVVLDIDGNSYSRRISFLCGQNVVYARGGLFDDVILRQFEDTKNYIKFRGDAYESLDKTLEQLSLKDMDRLVEDKIDLCHRLFGRDMMKEYIRMSVLVYANMVNFKFDQHEKKGVGALLPKSGPGLDSDIY